VQPLLQTPRAFARVRQRGHLRPGD
jgi:hypothetical protein